MHEHYIHGITIENNPKMEPGVLMYTRNSNSQETEEGVL